MSLKNEIVKEIMYLSSDWIKKKQRDTLKFYLLTTQKNGQFVL
jgi:hypothetical protein